MAVYVNVVAVDAAGAGHVSVLPASYPPASSPSTGTSTLNFSAGQAVANGILVRICPPSDFFVGCGADLDVQMGPAAAHIVVDITGYVYLRSF